MTEQETISIAETSPEAVTVQEAEPPRTLFAALAKAQASFAKVRKTHAVTVSPSKGRAYTYKYADLESILDAVRPALNAAGIYLYQHVTNRNSAVSCTTILTHESGEQLAGGEISIPISSGGMNSAQSLGSAITYARRYSLSAALGISADDDDDGRGVPAAEQATTPAAAPAPVVSAELKARAEAAANIGGEAYKALWKELSNADRNALVKSGIHAALKAVMQENSHE